MYIVKLHCYKEEINLEWTYTWSECFSSMKAAVRFGMRAYRLFDEVKDFKVEKMEKRGYAEIFW